MAVGLSGLPTLHPVAGIRLGTAMAGIRKKERRDLVVIECAPHTAVAAVFTRNRFRAAPVIVAQEHLARAAPRALLINTGYANAGTGDAGLQDARACCQRLADLLHCAPAEIMPFSTGVIGERLPLERVTRALPACVSALHVDGWSGAAHGIMTTDTVPKGTSRRISLDGRAVTVTGITKGAGMIRPDMATMLAFVATDAAVTPSALQAALAASVEESFNRITVDGDTSTNDACVLLATGQASNPVIDTLESSAGRDFAHALSEVCRELAHAIVRDGEGATKFITIEVTQGETEGDCLTVAYTIAHSPLVKTALFASDPNWGRILAAIGRAPVPRLDVGRVSLYLDDVCVVRSGELAVDYSETRGAAVMRQTEFKIGVELGAGHSAARIWTCDLSHDYVTINAEYRT